MVIVGGGIIGCEFASLYSILGVEVVILEMLPRILPMESRSVSEALAKEFRKRGIVMETGVKVEGIDKNSERVVVNVAGGKNFTADIALVAVGRKMNTNDIGLEKAGVTVQDNGMIPVNEKMKPM